jgi:PAS domain S-box-containing protein
MGDWQKKEPRLGGGFGSARETDESHDITSSELAEAASRQSEELFRASFAHAAVGLAINDLQGRFLEVNPAYCSITGYTQAELGALDFQTITHSDDLPKTMEQVRALLAGEIPAFVMEKRYVRKDGSIVWVQNSVSLTRDGEGRPISLVGFTQDISERKRVEEALREAERKYREIFENAGEGIFQTSPEGRTITANPALARMLGFESSEELIRERTDIAGQHYFDPQRREEFKRLMEAQGFVRGFEYQGRRKNGSEIWLSDSVRSVRAENGALLYYEGIAEDITERKRAEARSVAFASLARQLSGATAPIAAGQIIVDTAHELFGWDSCTLDLYDADRDLVFPILHLDTINEQRVDVTPFVDGAPPSPKGRRVIDLGAELILREEPCEFGEDSVPFGDRSRPSAAIMSVPVRHASKVIGILSIQSYTPRAYDDDALNNFQALADHCGEALNRIHAEEELRDSEERYRDLVENSRELICTHDLSGLILSANRAAAEVLGYPAKDYSGKKSLREILAPEVRDQFDDYLARLTKDGFASGLMLVQTSTGERRLWEYYNTLRTEGVAKPIVRGMARDITEPRRAEKAMSALRRELELTMNSMEEGVHRVDLQGNIVFENPAAASMLGWEVAELLGKPAHETMHHTRQDGTPYPKEECPIYATFRDGVSRQVPDEVFWRRDRTSFPVEYMTAAMRDDRNEIVATVVTFRDVTERRRAEVALLASLRLSNETERRYRDIFTFAPVGIYQSLRDGTLITANKALAEMLGYGSVDELLKAKLGADVYLTEDEREELIRGYEDRGYAGDREIPWKKKDGSHIWVELTAHAIRGTGGVTEYFEGFVRDCTDRKQAEEGLRESEERYRELVENSRDAIYVHNLSGRYTSVNRAAEELSGYTREEILGKHFWDFVAPEYDQQVRQYLTKKLEEVGETTYDVEIITRDGRRVPVEVSSRLIYENGAIVGVQGAARDITERKRAEEALRTYSRRLIDAQEAERQRIARELHDEIGQVLTAVRLNLQSVRRSFHTTDCLPRIEESILVVDEALGRVRELALELRPSLLDDLGLAAALRWYVDRYAQRAGIVAEFVSDLESNDRLRRELETACFRIAQEALTNVARHARASRVSAQLKRSREELFLIIKDNGVGFDVDRLLKSGSSLSALGLRGMEERALAVGGRIEIDSAATRGTEVRAAFSLESKR